MKKEIPSYRPREPFRWKKIIQYLLQGLLILAPLAITLYSIYWIVSTVDNWLPIFREPVKDFQGNVIGHKVKNYGLGFVVVLVTIISIGYLSTFFIQSKIFNLFDSWLEKTPGVKFIYSSVRDFFGAFTGDNEVGVYVPQAYHWAGQLYILPRNKVRKIEKISSGEAMKYAVTGGVVDLEEERKEEIALESAK